MSLVEVLFSRKEIIIGLVAAGLLLLLAVLLAVVIQVRAVAQKRALRKLRAARVLAAELAAEPATKPATEAALSDAQAPVATETTARPPSSGASGPNGAPTAPNPAAATTILTTTAPATTEPTANAEPEISSAMKDILANVFMDDEQFERYDALLQSIEIMDIDKLKALAEQVAEGLRAQHATPA